MIPFARLSVETRALAFLLFYFDGRRMRAIGNLIMGNELMLLRFKSRLRGGSGGILQDSGDRYNRVLCIS